MFGDFTLTDAESTAPVAVQIREGNYSSESLSRASDHDYRVTVAHSVEKSGYERHLLKVSKEIHANGATPAYLIEAYTIVRCKPGDSVKAAKIAQSLGHVLTDANLTKLVNWET